MGCFWGREASSLQIGPPPPPPPLEVGVAAPPVLPGTCLAPLAEVSVTAGMAALCLGALCLTMDAPLVPAGTPSFWVAFPSAVAECCRCLCLGGDGGGRGPAPAPLPTSRSCPGSLRRPSGSGLDAVPPPSIWAGTCLGMSPGGLGRGLTRGAPPPPPPWGWGPAWALSALAACRWDSRSSGPFALGLRAQTRVG